jgi:predicted transglutaminase-like cysteine proteinase
LQAVNDFWNQNVVGGEDQQIWGEAEYWATPLEAWASARAIARTM